MLDILVERMAGKGVPARKIWLPPLSAPPTLDQLLPPLAETEFGLQATNWANVPP
ncbi:MAG: hypothetical protein ABI232_03895 [Jatrophihabitantaceae bacterium]